MHSLKQRFDKKECSTGMSGQATAAREFEMARNILLLVMLCLCFASVALTQTSVGTTQVAGTVFVADSQGPSYVPGAKVTLLSSTIAIEQDTDPEGRFSFSGLAPGPYRIAAQFPGLEADKSITVEPGKPVNVALELKPSAVSTEITVTANPADAKADDSTGTISATEVRDAPNQNERAENILALIPGVVRGPDGRINIKGARNTQSGALMNGANVTDPATGSAAFDVPIDVVASVQVISNPYDPQYGKLTGAVSTMDTKTSDYEKFHFSVQNIMPRVRVREGSIFGVGGATPRMTITGPVMKDRIAFTQSVEYRFVRTPVNSLPAFERDTTLQGVNSYTQVDLNLTPKQTATVYPLEHPATERT
jgi:hypothetical protein